MNEDKVIPVRVAVRCRPLVTKEITERCKISVQFVPGEPQIVLDQDKCFTYDYAFRPESSQEEFYNVAVADRIDYIFKGYNVTVLAYGQTGSGKTYTMGTAYSSASGDDESQLGVIQRAVGDIFTGIQKRSDESEFIVKVSFLEVYKEDVFDLLHKSKENSPIMIREDSDGIKVTGLTEQHVNSAEEALKTLEQGSLARTTASTAMNARSSRSHGIFSVIVEQTSIADPTDFVRSKFHLVDLAGSERANKTGAVGERFKEGVTINKGLLALGNVISALCDDLSHIPYRDSKLTRLLQDSLGGNSHTVMVACISPADSNSEETLNTLRYADRARKIKNKPIVNRDPQSMELMTLRQEIQQLKSLIQNRNVNGLIDDGLEKGNNVKILLSKNEILENENGKLNKELQSALNQIASLCEKSFMAELSKENLIHSLEELYTEFKELIAKLTAENHDHLILSELQALQEKIFSLLYNRAKNDQKNADSLMTKELEEMPELLQDTKSLKDGQQPDVNEGSLEDEFQLNSTLKQAAIIGELRELDHALALKEELASKMKENDNQMSIMRMHFENNRKNMEEEIANLQKEKEELMNALKAAHASNNAGRVSEQRRKRLQECEAQIAKLKREIQEKSKIMKIKEEAQRKVGVLQQEIQHMKSTRVRLLKQMKEESERYRQWKLQKDREVAQLKQKDRRKEYEISKMKREFIQQKNVMKRKMEEATAANKRLNNALQQQKAVAARRMKEKQNSFQGVGTRVQQWLSQEIEVVLSSKEATFHLENLVEDRKTILNQLNILRQGCESDRSEKSGDDSEDNSETSSQIKSLEEELELQNMQIKDLQQKILDADQEEKSKQRWETIQNLVEGKCALKWLFERVIAAQMELFLQKSSSDQNLEEAEMREKLYASQIQKLHSEIESLRKEKQALKHNHDKEISKLVRENEDKTLYFLKQLSMTTTNVNSAQHVMESDDNLMKRIQFQEKEINNLQYLHDEIEKKNQEIEDLKQGLIRQNAQEIIRPFVDRNSMNRTFLASNMSTTKTVRAGSFTDVYLEDDLGELSSNSMSSNDENDPDWRLTPLYKQKKISRRLTTRIDTETPNRKRPAPVTCTCHSNCKSMRCKCKKKRKVCDEMCGCNKDICLNKTTSPQSGESDTSNPGSLTFVSKTNDSLEIDAPSVLAELNSNSLEQTMGIFCVPKIPEKRAKVEDGNTLLEVSGVKRKLHQKARRQILSAPVLN